MQKFCTSPQLSTCGNARFQLIKLCNKYKKREKNCPKTGNNSLSTRISNVKWNCKNCMV